MYSAFFSFRKSFSIFAFVILASLSSSGVVHADEKEEYLSSVTHRLAVAMEEVFYRFSDQVMRKYCFSQYDLMMDYISTVYQNDMRITLTELANRKEEAMSVLLDECENKPQVIALESQFNEFISLHSADVISRVKHLLEYEDEEKPLFARIELAEQVVEVVLQQDFNEKKILEQIEAGGVGSDSAIRMKYLESSASTVTLDYHVLLELEQSAQAEAKKAEVKKTQKKGRCFECNKKLGLMPFECACHLEFCVEHRFPEAHHCTFDHKAAARERLRQSMPVVVGDKVKNRI